MGGTRRLVAIVLAAASAAAAGAPSPAPATLFTQLPAAAPAACSFEYVIVPRFEQQPRGFDVMLSFDAAGRTATPLLLHDEFAAATGLGRSIVAVTGTDGAEVRRGDAPARWTVQHAAAQRVSVRYRVQASLKYPDSLEPQAPDQAYRPQVGENWLQFIGQAALLDVRLTPEQWDRLGPSLRSCVRFEGLPPRAAVLSSHGVGTGASHVIATDGPPLDLMSAFYGAGPGWRLQTRRLRSGALHVAVRSQWAMNDDRFAEEVARAIAAHRNFWGDAPEPDQLVVLTANQAERGRHSGLRLHRTAVLSVARNFDTDSDAFRELVGHENLHEWIPDRFGPSQDGDHNADTWFSEGFTEYYTHRLLVRSGIWSLQRYAEEMTGTIRRYRESPNRAVKHRESDRLRFADQDIGRLPYLRGEFLALRWDAALRAKGHEGLDAIVRSLLLQDGEPDPAQPATQRLLAALRGPLQDLPRDDVVRYVEEGHEFEFGPDTLGPCFDVTHEQVPPWVLGFGWQSFESRRVTGVDPNGPAWPAGLRDGMVLAGWSVPSRDSRDEVELWIDHGSAGSAFRVSYLPRGKGLIEQPRYRARPDAPSSAACKAWMMR